MTKIKNKFQLIGLFIPKYFKMTTCKIRLKIMYLLHKNKQSKFKKANKNYCSSFYKFFRKYNNNEIFCNKDIEPLKNAVFVYWNSGIENMPKITKICFDRLNTISRFKVILLTDENIDQYSSIDKEILDMHKAGKISNTLFSDILRFNLLCIHDCVWLDATVFLKKDFPLDIMEYDFVSPYCENGKSLFDNIPELYKYPDLSLSQSYFLAGNNKNIFIKLYNLLVIYLKNETRFLELARPYYLAYFVFEYLNDNDEEFKNRLRRRVPSNKNAEGVEGLKNQVYSESKYGYIFSDSTFLYKLSYKMNFTFKKDNQLTVFGKFAEIYNISEENIL